MKKLLMMLGVAMVAVVAFGDEWTDPETGIKWSYTVSGGAATVTGADPATGAITIPSALGGYPVTYIGACAFEFKLLESVTIQEGVEEIGNDAFYQCERLATVSCPSTLTFVDKNAFAHCSRLRSVYYHSALPPAVGIAIHYAYGEYETIYEESSPSLVSYIAWKPSSGVWCSRDWAQYGSPGGSTNVTVTMISTNVVVHYIQTSELSPMAAPITPDVGIVNVMTEIEGGGVAIPESWATNYPSFKQKFGDDFAVALTRETGKFDANRKPMYVWQDYVAGTDPTDVEDQFRASVTMVGGKPVISFTPVLSEKEAAKRVYTTYGKVKLQDEQWEVIETGEEENYNFFKVTVKMK